jgi:hypothetical protein
MKTRRHLLTLIGAVAGSALFAWAIRQAGISDTIDGIRRVGWGLILVLASGGVRFVLRGECWRLCVPRSGMLTRRQAFSAFLAGDALGSVTPLGLLASEPTKVFLTRHHLATRESVSSLALETLVYTASVVAMVLLGLAVLMTTVALPSVWRWAAAGTVAATLIVAVAALRLLQGTWDEERGARPRWREKLSGVRQAVLGFSTDYRGRLGRVFGLDLLFHAVAVLEIYVTLRWLLGPEQVTLAQAIVFEALNRVITIAFKFVPFRIGVDEASSGALAPLLALDPTAGVTLAVIRKIRNLFWSGVGLVIVAAHPAQVSDRLPAAPGTDRPESARARRP